MVGGLKTSAAPGPSPFRIGSVPYLNAVPLTYGLGTGVTYLPPSELARKLHGGFLDAALLSVTEVLSHPGYDVLDGVAIASDGPVASVFLAHQDPLNALGEVHLDPASCTSVNLLRVLLSGLGPSPKFVPLMDYATAEQHRNVLLIGNPAIDFRRQNHPHALWDLGEAWRLLTGLPFVYAVWVLRRGVPRELLTRLRNAREAGLSSLPEIIASRPEFDLNFRKAYLGGHIQYGLGPREKAGLESFAQLYASHNGGNIFPVKYVGEHG